MGQAVPFKAMVAVPHTLTAEYSAYQNKLFISDMSNTPPTRTVYSNGEVYKVAATAPTGCVNITVHENDGMPDLVGSLTRQKIVSVVEKHYDEVFHQMTYVCRVLI